MLTSATPVLGRNCGLTCTVFPISISLLEKALMFLIVWSFRVDINEILFFKW